MVNVENIWFFINYNYEPFSKKQCIKRLAFIWFFSLLMCLIGARLEILEAGIVIANIGISSFFLVLVFKYSTLKISRFLCDGVTYFYIAIILNLASYRFLTLEIKKNIVLLLILLLLLFIDIGIFMLIVYKNIKLNKYSLQEKGGKLISLPFLMGTGGFFVAKSFLQDASQESITILISTILLLLSCMVGIGSLNLLKAVLMIKIQKEIVRQK